MPVGLIFWLLGGGRTLAAATSPTGITVSPAFAQIALKDEAEHPVTFQITNNLSQPQTILLSTADFNSLNESGGLFFVGTNPLEIQNKYGLANWMSFSQPKVTIPPKQTASLTVVILNRADLASGGHYGALMMAIDTGTSLPGQKNKIALQPIASSLLFVDKVGGDIYRLNLTTVQAPHNFLGPPTKVTLRFQNNGNTHLTPRGTVTITDPHGKVVSRGIVNENSALILPEKARLYTVDLSKVSTPVAPGRYRLVVNYRFDGYDQFRTYQKSFFVLPFNLIALAIIVVVLAGSIIYLLTSRLGPKKSRFLSKKYHI